MFRFFDNSSINDQFIQAVYNNPQTKKYSEVLSLVENINNLKYLQKKIYIEKYSTLVEYDYFLQNKSLCIFHSILCVDDVKKELYSCDLLVDNKKILYEELEKIYNYYLKYGAINYTKSCKNCHHLGIPYNKRTGSYLCTCGKNNLKLKNPGVCCKYFTYPQYLLYLYSKKEDEYKQQQEEKILKEMGFKENTNEKWDVNC